MKIKHIFHIITFLVLCSCQKKDWKVSLLEEIKDYETLLEIDQKYSLKHADGYSVLIKVFSTNSNGLTKLTALYERPELGSWEKLFYLKNDKVQYSRNFGVALIENLKNDTLNQSKYVFVEKRVWFENDNTEKEEVRELVMFDLKDIKSKKEQLLKIEFITSDLDVNDYLLLESDYELLMNQTPHKKRKHPCKT